MRVQGSAEASLEARLATKGGLRSGEGQTLQSAFRPDLFQDLPRPPQVNTTLEALLNIIRKHESGPYDKRKRMARDVGDVDSDGNEGNRQVSKRAKRDYVVRNGIIEIVDSDAEDEGIMSDGFAERILVVRRYQSSNHHLGRTAVGYRRINNKLKAKYFPTAPPERLHLAVQGKSILQAVIALHTMNRSERNGLLTPDRDTIPIDLRLRFSRNIIEEEIRTALWYCIHCIDAGKDELRLKPRPMREEASSAKELEYCAICIESLTDETMIRCSGNGQHKICRSCVEKMIKIEVWEKKKHEFTCFADP